MKQKIQDTLMWAIKHNDMGLYTGTALTRKEAIRQFEQDIGRSWVKLRDENTCVKVKLVEETKDAEAK